MEGTYFAARLLITTMLYPGIFGVFCCNNKHYVVSVRAVEGFSQKKGPVIGWNGVEQCTNQEGSDEKR